VPSRSRKRSTSKYVTPFDVSLASSYLRGVKSIARDSYGVASLIRFKNHEGIRSIRDVKYHVFSHHEDEFLDYSGEGILSEEEFTKAFSGQLKLGNPSESMLTLALYDFAGVDNPGELLQLKPDSSHVWDMLYFYLEDHSLFPLRGAMIPPGMKFVDGKIEPEEHIAISLDDLLDPSEHEGNASRFLDSVIEYTYNGGHLIGVFWDKEDCPPAKAFFRKYDGENLSLILAEYVTGALSYNLLVENMDNCIHEEEKFHVIMQSIVDIADMDCDIEVRGWEVIGDSIKSLNEDELKNLIEGKYSSSFTERNFIFCDSWDYPVSRIDSYTLTLERNLEF
jgi:hypothetical protein